MGDYSFVIDNEGKVQGIWLKDPSKANDQALLMMLLAKHQHPIDGYMQGTRTVPNTVDNAGGCFVMFGSAKAPGEDSPIAWTIMPSSAGEQTKSETAPRRSVPVWAQIIIWVGLLGLLGVVALKLLKAQEPMIKKGATVPDFTVPFYDGYGYNGATEVKFSSLRGKVVVINFWASWCIPCEQEAADLQKAWETYQPGGEVVFLGIDYVDTPIKGAAYLKKFSITYPNGPDLQESISPLFNRNMGVPETYFIDRNGVLREIQIGPFNSVTEIKAIIDPLLAEK